MTTHRRQLFGDPNYVDYHTPSCSCGWIGEPDFYDEATDQFMAHIQADELRAQFDQP